MVESENLSEKTFVISNAINPGDSGGPVLIKNGDDYLICGIAYARLHYEGMGLVYKGDYVQKTIKDIIKQYELRKILHRYL